MQDNGIKIAQENIVEIVKFCHYYIQQFFVTYKNIIGNFLLLYH